jgi:hypothetical protein
VTTDVRATAPAGSPPREAAAARTWRGPSAADRLRIIRRAKTVAMVGASDYRVMGALPTLYAATAPGVNGCDYIGPTGMGGSDGG